jgi:cystathionine beta-lyase family protein involved in aluminum resistance
MNTHRTAVTATILVASLIVSPALAQSSQDMASSGGQAARMHEPKIHIVEVVDQSGCKNLKGGLATGGGMLLGILGAKAAGTGVAPALIGKEVGSQIDKKSRCRQAINIQPGVAQ